MWAIGRAIRQVQAIGTALASLIFRLPESLTMIQLGYLWSS